MQAGVRRAPARLDTAPLPAALSAGLPAPTDDDAERAVVDAPDAEALGRLYEQHRAAADGGGRKATGAWYTPPHLVERVLDGALAGVDASTLVCDPACGAGAFLAAAARRLRGGGADPAALVAGAVCGVDLDPTAVFLARLSLWRAAGRPVATERLVSAVQLGDALGAAARTLFDAPGFHWPAAFPAAFTAERGPPGPAGWRGGFDVVVGNPPYRAGRRAGLDAAAARARFASAEYQVDPYVLFLERGLDLLRAGGRLGFVVPNSWLSNHRAGRLRAHLLRHACLTAVVEVPADTFAASVETIVVHAIAGRPTTADVPVTTLDGAPAGRLLVDPERPAAPLPLARDDAAAALVRAAARWTATLGDVCEVTRGINPYHRLTHTPEQIAARVHHAEAARGPDWRPELRGRDLRGPLHLRWGGRRFVHYGPWLKEPRKPRFFEGPRVLVRKVLGQRLHAAFVTEPWLCDQSVYVARLRPACPWPGADLAGLLSSTLMASLVRARHQEDDLIFPQLKVRELRALPLPPVAPDDPRVRALAERVLALQRAPDGPDAADLAALDAQVAALYGAPAR